MTDDTNEIVVEIEKEPPAADDQQERPRGPDGKFVKADDAGKRQDEPAADLAAQFKDLEAREREQTQAREAAERRAAEAERRAAAATADAEAAKSEVADSNLGTITAGIDAAKSEKDAAKSRYRVAAEAGNWDAMAEEQDKISAANARLAILDEAKANIEARKTERKPEGREPERQERQPAGDPVETFLSSRTGPTRDWLRSHPDHARALAMEAAGRASPEEAKRAAKLSAAHSDARAEGLKPDSSEYFAHVETFIGAKTAADTSGQQQRTRRAAAPPVAPVNGGGGNGASAANVVHLTQGEAKAATDGTIVWNYDDSSPQKKFKKGEPIGVQEFARRKQSMKQSGLYDKTYVEQ